MLVFPSNSIWIYWPIKIHSQKPLTISSWLKTVIPNLLPGFGESILWTHLMRKQQIHAERDLTHSPATQKAYIFLDHTSQSTPTEHKSVENQDSLVPVLLEQDVFLWMVYHCGSERHWRILWFIFLGQIRLIFILLFVPVFKAARLCQGKIQNAIWLPKVRPLSELLMVWFWGPHPVRADIWPREAALQRHCVKKRNSYFADPATVEK